MKRTSKTRSDSRGTPYLKPKLISCRAMRPAASEAPRGGERGPPRRGGRAGRAGGSLEEEDRRRDAPPLQCSEDRAERNARISRSDVEDDGHPLEASGLRRDEPR